MKLKIFLLLLCTISLQALAQKSTIKEDIRFRGLDTVFQRVLKTWHAAGFAVAVVHKNQVIYAKGFGYRDIEAKLPVTPNTLFAIGSCSKSFTTALIGMLQNEGKLNIDKPVNNYLPKLKFYNDALTNNITLRDMMSHRTGLPRFDLSWYFFNTSSVDSLIQRVQYMEPTAGIREKWQYNNFMYATQGAVAEKLTGKSWGENIKEKIFIPLEMSHSNVSIPEMEKSGEVSFGYTLREDDSIKKMEYYHIEGMSPAGAINSNLNDMAKWLIAWINNGKYGGKEVIPSAFCNEAISSQSILDGSLPSKKSPDSYFSNYGFGWFMDSYKGHYRVEHGGNIDGFTANTCFFPSDSLGIVVLSNQNVSKIPGIVRNIISDRILNLQYQDWNSKSKSEEVQANKEREQAINEKNASAKHNPATHPLNNFAGNYSHPAYGTMKIYVENDSLFTKTHTHIYWLRHGNYNAFELFEKDPKEGIDLAKVFGINIQFHLSISGEVDGFESELEGGIKPFLFVREEEKKPVTNENAKKQPVFAGFLIQNLGFRSKIKERAKNTDTLRGKPLQFRQFLCGFEKRVSLIKFESVSILRKVIISCFSLLLR
ncbi:hypothetical protein FGO68_gene11060 [Halteria grandinella]|uniref:Uncharacterized protein n=1 Tax=Halteria grandinella TaxID=5974 RepID=A0A8J8SV94_HALGN|nr:hypothetical protein FGO68_gene11060 [Halteria grandinella]